MDIEPRYSRLEKIGEGAYGAVYKALNLATDQVVAIKVCRFDDMDEGLPSTCMREITFLKNLNHPHLVKLLDAQTIKGTQNAIELVFEYVDFDLSKYIRMKMDDPKRRGLSEPEAKNIIRSILLGIHYLHQKGFLHRDLKPHNILVSKDDEVKIADFGLGRVCSCPLETMSKEIETLWYRSPELLLGSRNYDFGVDIWSIGCIFYELMEGNALFQSESEIGQLFEIFKVLGTPHVKDWPEITDMDDFKPSFPKFDPRPISVKRMSCEGVKWMMKLLKANPRKRLSVEEALFDDYMCKK